MRLDPVPFAGRALAVVVAIAAGALAWRSGGGADPPADPPRPADRMATASLRTTSAEGEAGATGPESYVATLRLVEDVKDARIDAPGAAQAVKALKPYWRKLKPPFVPPQGEASQLVTSIALRTSVTETQWAIEAGGKQWAPDAKIWNMNEGSFDQREAIVAPAPSTFTFRVAVPKAARLTFAEGTANATKETTVFTVTVIDESHVEHEVYRHRVPPRDARRWSDASCDLSAFAGRAVDLRLGVDVSPSTDEERKMPPRPREPVERPRPPPRPVASAAHAAPARTQADAGAESADAGVAPDPLASPSTPIALWGNPTVLGRSTSRVPYNVLWIVVDALRPDAIASFHDDADDAKKLHAPHPPLEALLPKIPGLTPSIDDLAKRGVRFTSAYSGGSWTRPGTLSMLTGARSSELGIDTLGWLVSPTEAARFYSADPPLLPLILRRNAVATRAFVNNYFMVGYAAVGVDMGFERLSDHRYRTRDTSEITTDATRWIQENKDTRFCLFVNYVSPHDPYEPPPEHLAKVPPPPAGPRDDAIRKYLGEVAKDDEAIGALMKKLDETGLRDRTIVVLTADHGETMSSAHAGKSLLDNMPIRYHHAVSNYEETTRVPILVVAPGMLPADREVKERVRSTDIAPTVLDLLGMEPHPRMSGRSLAPLARGTREPDERVVVTEGRGTRGLIHGRYRLIVREGPVRTTIDEGKTRTVSEELFDLVDDPGERHDIAPARPDLVQEMKARLHAALSNVPVAGSAAAVARDEPEAGRAPVLRLRFAGADRPRRVSGAISFGDAKTQARSFEVTPVELGRDATKASGSRVELAFATAKGAAVGFDVVVDPPTAPIAWELFLDDAPWPDQAVFAGPYGLATPMLKRGVTSDDARFAADAPFLPPIDPRRDVGLFVVRERRGEEAEARESTDEGAEEMARLLREWGYAHASGSGKN